MADIPKHLLERAAARRAALSGGEAPAPVASVEAAPASVPAVAAPAAPVAAAGAGGAGAPPTIPAAAPAGPPPVPAPPRGFTFARIGSVFMLVAVPVWSFFMFNAFSESGASAETPEAIGKTLYEANCVSCHAASGAGSEAGLAGRPLYKGEVEKTFPNPVDQFAFVRHGSCEGGVPYGNPKREGGQHAAKKGMPNFGEATLSDEELIAVINYERYVLNGKAYPANLLAKADAPEETVTSIVPQEEVVKTLKETKITTEDVCG
jgi:mono/diheme cytochrome c family protein